MTTTPEHQFRRTSATRNTEKRVPSVEGDGSYTVVGVDVQIVMVPLHCHGVYHAKSGPVKCRSTHDHECNYGRRRDIACGRGKTSYDTLGNQLAKQIAGSPFLAWARQKGMA